MTGFIVAGIIGTITLICLFPKVESLETYIMACVFSIGVIIATIVAGTLIGKFISSKTLKKSKPADT